VIDYPGDASGFTDATVLAGCGTQRNQQHGVLITNTSSTGTDWRDPVVISGCSFDEDGSGPVNNSGSYTGGPYAGIWVEGNNRVWITGSTVFVDTIDYPSGCPQYGLATGAVGTAPGAPELIVMTGGHLNYTDLTAGAAYRPPQYLYISPDVTSSPGYESGTIDSRLGTAVLAGGSVIVTNPWSPRIAGSSCPTRWRAAHPDSSTCRAVRPGASRSAPRPRPTPPGLPG
jgi:hypothetical protein